ncbi:MAG TPA: hypothetical protein VES79_05240 [Solirubrobacteraceae bacterium]|nr:hypothetical protein [Solirubrobacteraceae bacterium]
MSEHGDPIAYTALRPGTPIVSSDEQELGTVERVIANAREHIFDGIVMRAGERRVWVDAPEVARIFEHAVILSLDAAAAGKLPAYEPGAPEYRANTRAGRLGRFFGGGWKKS